MLLILLPAILGALTVGIATYSLATPARSARIDSRLGKLDRATLTERELKLALPFLARVGMPIVGLVRGSFARILPTTIAHDLERRIVVAGEPVSLYGFLTVQLGAMAMAIALFVGAISVGLVGTQAILALIFSSVIAALPLVWLDKAAAARRKAILRRLPDSVDLIVTMVEAGMSIDAALWRVAEETEGPLAEELTHTMRELTLGRDRREAMLDLATRSDVSELRTFVQSIVHAQSTGVPLGQVLRSQANAIRLEKRQRSEEAAAKAPVKVLLLMLFFVMPSLLIVLLGPAFMRLSNAL